MRTHAYCDGAGHTGSGLIVNFYVNLYVEGTAFVSVTDHTNERRSEISENDVPESALFQGF